MISKLRSVFFLLLSLLLKAASTIGAGVSTRHDDKCEPFFFSSGKAKIQARCWFPSAYCTLALIKWAPGPCILVVVFDGSRVNKSTVFTLSSSFKMASNRAKWSKIAHSYISGTQGVVLKVCQYPGTGCRASNVNTL